MTTRDSPIILVLALLDAYIWLQDLSWTSDSADALPILLALPTFIWLGKPWNLHPQTMPIPTTGLVLTVTSFVVGIITGWALMLSLGWTILLWTWLSTKLDPEGRQHVKKLLILPLMSFPWLLLDGDTVGWWFRLSGSWVSGQFFSLTGFHALQEGTSLLVQGIPVDVSAACSGINALQSMLIAGSALAYIFVGHHPVYWLNLPLLIVISWVANTLRIIVIALAALTVSPEFAAGLFHDWGGLGVLVLMFLLCWAFFSMEKSLLQKQKPARK